MEIKIKNLAYKKIIKNINTTIKSKEIVAIIGKNRSGKSTFLRLVCGKFQPSTGEISKINKSDISYLLDESDNTLFNINVLGDITYGMDTYDKNKIYEMIKLFNLNKDILSKNYSELSDGEIKKIELISCLIKNNKVIILDNPEAKLDNKSVDGLIKVLKKLKREGRIILLTSNNSNFLLRVSDRVLVIDNGKILIDSDKYTVLGNKRVMNKINMIVPNIMEFQDKIYSIKNIKLINRDNINDLIKDVYRNAK